VRCGRWLWAGLRGMSLVAMATGCVITMLDVKAAPSVVGVVWQFLATAILYPFAHRLIDRFEDADVRFR